MEAKLFLDILRTYLPEETIVELTSRLEQKCSTEVTLKQHLNEVNELLKPVPPPKWKMPALYVLIVLHFILVCGIISSFFVLPFFAPWFVALPIMLFIWFFSTSKNIECKMTNLENKWRKDLGMKQIGGFVGYYFKKPILRTWNRIFKS